MFKIILSLLLVSLSLNASEESMLTPREHDYKLAKYTFKNGDTLENINLHYSTVGTPQKDEQGNITNAVLMLHWTGADGKSLQTDEFKEALYNSKKPLDASKYFLIFPDCIGHGLSSKPSRGLKMNFPQYTYADAIDLQYKLITEELKISHLKMIIGTSMGGMQAWLWGVTYPNFMDGIMPIVSLPTKITGRNLLWRQALIASITEDPAWREGNYEKPPQGLISGWHFARMILDGVPHLSSIIQDIPSATNFLKESSDAASKMDANDLIYVLRASKDYNPQPDLQKIQAKVFALDFSDDQLDPVVLDTLNTLIQDVKRGKATIQPGTKESFGHLTMAHPKIWADQVTNFIFYLDANTEF